MTTLPTDDLQIPTLPVALRTLMAGGFLITGVQRQAVHAEFSCERLDVLGMTIRYLILFAESVMPRDEVLQARAEYARSNGRVFVVIGPGPVSEGLQWTDFLSSLGGAVPAWRALSPEYRGILEASSVNTLPQGLDGEPWAIFEDAAGDGFEFILGRRVRRLGSRKRGRRLGDLVTQIPDGAVLVLDTKASQNPFDVGFPELRPLVEYINNQHVRQIGAQSVASAVVLAAAFKQDAARLTDLSNEFLSVTQVPVTFLEVRSLIELVETFTDKPVLRNKMHWRRVLCRVGLTDLKILREELTRASDETV